MTAKALKTITLTAVAEEAHNLNKINSILRWLKLGHQVRVSITGRADRQKAMDNIFQRITRDIKTGAILNQKVVKPDVIKFQLNPTKDAAQFEVQESIKISGDYQLPNDKDLLSDDFATELDMSIREDIEKLKGKK